MPKTNSRKKKSPKRVLPLPDLEQAKTAVLNSLRSAGGQRTYDHAISEFVAWYCSEPPWSRLDPGDRAASWVQAEASGRGERHIGHRTRARRVIAIGARVDMTNVRPWRLLESNRAASRVRQRLL
jgi:hypothetical protein